MRRPRDEARRDVRLVSVAPRLSQNTESLLHLAREGRRKKMYPGPFSPLLWQECRQPCRQPRKSQDLHLSRQERVSHCAAGGALLAETCEGSVARTLCRPCSVFSTED